MTSPRSDSRVRFDPKTGVLATPRLRLRKLVAEDVDWLWDLDSDPVVMQFITGGVPTPRRALEDVILPRMLAEVATGSQYGFYAVLPTGQDHPVGWFHLRPEKEPPYAMDLGYRLVRSAWGRGLATEGSKALLAMALGAWGLPRVVAHTLASNVASWRVMEKCGMRRVGELLCPESWFPGWSEAQRKAVRYEVEAREFSTDLRPIVMGERA